MLTLQDEKPIQVQTTESKESGSVGSHVFLRYIQASVWGLFGLVIIFLLFMGSSTINLLVNWWLGRWANAERIRYDSKSMNSSCNLDYESSIINMTVDQWHQTQNNYFYVLLGEHYRAKINHLAININFNCRTYLTYYFSIICAHHVLFLLQSYCCTNTSQSNVQFNTSCSYIILRFDSDR